MLKIQDQSDSIQKMLSPMLGKPRKGRQQWEQELYGQRRCMTCRSQERKADGARADLLIRTFAQCSAVLAHLLFKNQKGHCKLLSLVKTLRILK